MTNDSMKLRGLLSEWGLFLLPYTLAFGLILFNKGLFFEDWITYRNTPEHLIRFFSMLGVRWPAYFHNLVLSAYSPMLVYRSVTFFSHFLAGLCLNSILKTVKEIDPLSRKYLILFFLFFPVNSARISTNLTVYSLCNLFFFAGLWLTKEYLDRGRAILRILSQTVFFVSMTMNSIVMFYLIVFAYIFYREDQTGRFFKRVKSLRNYPDYIALPLLFAFVKFTFLAPSGRFEDYNRIYPSQLIAAPFKFILAFYTSFIQPINQSVVMITTIPVFVFFVTFLLYRLISLMSSDDKKRVHYLWGLLGGLAMLFLGLFPYLAVDKVPRLDNYESRHQLLVPLGASFLIFYGIGFLFDQLNLKERSKHFLLCSLLSLFAMSNFDTYLGYQRDWYKKLSLAHHFSESDIIKDHSSFLLDDRLSDSNMGSGLIDLLDYPDFFKMVFHDQKLRNTFDERTFSERALHPTSWWGTISSVPKTRTDESTMVVYTPQRPQYRIIVQWGDIQLTNNLTLKLLAMEYFQPRRFQKLIGRVIKVDYEKL